MCMVKIGAPIAGTRKLRNRTNPAPIDASDDGLPTIECIQPNKNPHSGPNPRRKYAYSPPASGIIAPSSANASAPNSDKIPPTIHAAKTTETNRPSRAISAGFKKIPVPIIAPTTIAAEAQAPRPRTRSIRFSVVAAVATQFPTIVSNLMYGRSTAALQLGKLSAINLVNAPQPSRQSPDSPLPPPQTPQSTRSSRTN